MKETRYRISDRRGWYCNYSSESKAAKALADRLKMQLAKFRFYEVKLKKDISEQQRNKIIAIALRQLADSIPPE